MDWNSNASSSDYFNETNPISTATTIERHFYNSFQFNSTVLTKTNTTEAISTTSTENTTVQSSVSYNQTLRFYPALSTYNEYIDSKFIEKINSFWLEFDPPNRDLQYVIAFIYMALTVVGVIGNAFVIFMYIRCKSLRTPANILVINLCISDFFMLVKGPVVIYNSFKLGPASGDLGCRIYGFLGGLTGVGSIATLTAIAIDRYHVIVYPLNPLRSTTTRRSRLMVLFIWCYSFFFSIIPAIEIGYSRYVPEGFLTSCSFDYLTDSPKARIFMFIFFLCAWCLPFLIITYCYFYILKVVIGAKKIQSSKEKNKTEIKLAGIVIGIIAIWFISWTPYALVALFGISGNKEYLTPFLSMIPAIFCKSSACINPYIYAVTHPRFRMEFRRMFCGELPVVKRTSTFRSSILDTTRGSTKRRRHIVSEGNSSDQMDIQDISNGNNNVVGHDGTEMAQQIQHANTVSNNNNENESTFTVEIPKY